jgi:energy-coupling factor transporter transmembrane protein EcfT
LGGRPRLLAPLLGGSLERALNLAEAMEARGFGLSGATRAAQPSWSAVDRIALPAAVALVAIGALWL